jgi:hypothetical protein
MEAGAGSDMESVAQPTGTSQHGEDVSQPEIVVLLSRQLLRAQGVQRAELAGEIRKPAVAYAAQFHLRKRMDAVGNGATCTNSSSLSDTAARSP